MLCVSSLNNFPNNVEYLVVAGGGGGEQLCLVAVVLVDLEQDPTGTVKAAYPAGGTYTVTVGAGGLGGLGIPR